MSPSTISPIQQRALSLGRYLYNARRFHKWKTWLVGLVCSGFFLAALRYKRMCEAAFLHYRSLLDSDRWDSEIAGLKQYADDTLSNRREGLSRIPSHLDIVCTGGGFKNCYSAGVLFALSCSGITFGRFAGASAGAQIAFVMMAGQLDDCIRWALSVAGTFSRFPFVRPGPFWDYFYHRCANRAKKPEDGAFTVSVTQLLSIYPPKVENQLVSNFSDQQDVGNALMATAALPLFICTGFWTKWHGMRVLDGGLTNNTPHFRDGQRPQLVITFESLEARFAGRPGGIYWSAAEMLEVIRLGISDAVALLEGLSPPGLQIVSAEESLKIPAPPPVTSGDIIAAGRRLLVKA